MADRMNRREFLAAGLASVTSISGCLGDGDTTPTPTSEAPMADVPGGDGDSGLAPTAEPTPTAADTATEPPETDAPETPEATPDPGQDVLVDQVGYLPEEEAVGIVRAAASTFEVRDAESGSVVRGGDLSAPTEATSAGETVRYADLGDLPAGEYVLSVDSGAESHPFAIEEGAWGTVLAEIGRHYTLQRANTRIDDPITGLDLQPGHPQDREAKMYFADEFHEEGEPIDVHGGWYDAGDYGKYVPPAAVTVGQLLLAYEWNPDTFEVGQFAMPEGVSADERDAGMPDLLAEVKFELEWMERMQRPDGAVYHKVSGTQWPGLDVRPVEDTQTRYVFGLSTYGTAMYAGAMAMAARVYESVDADFADRALSNAEEAFDFLESHPDPIFRSDEGQNSGSGAYRQDDDRTERFWAACELLKTTGDSRYADYLESTLTDQFAAGPDPISWTNGRLFGQWAYYTAEAGSSDRTSEIANALVSRADDIAAHIEDEGYHVSLTPEEYYWASAKVAVAKGNLLLMANEVEAKPEYVRGARHQVHYLLGRSPTTYAYVTKAGEHFPENPHDRIVQSTGINVPGHLVGGPNDDGNDPIMEQYIEEEDPPPAKAYLDHREAYSVNEPAIDYAAPLFFALANFTPASAISPK